MRVPSGLATLVWVIYQLQIIAKKNVGQRKYGLEKVQGEGGRTKIK
jgi:hypothetical protein